MLKRKHLIAVAVCFVVVGCAVWFAQKLSEENAEGSAVGTPGALQEGVHFRTLDNPLLTDAHGVSVMEFFWYGCPHCRDFEPLVHEWLANAAADIKFELKPVTWNDATRLHAAMYFVGRKSEQPDALHAALFDVIIDLRQERNLASQVEQSADVFAKHGISSESLQQALKSPGINAAVELSAQQMRAAEISSTPTVLVGGRYAVLNTEAVADMGVFKVVDALVEKVR